MRASFFISAIVAILVSCQTKQIVVTNNVKPLAIQEETKDSTKYELLIFDIKYDTFLSTQPPQEFYSQNYYENWNLRYVTEWNIRHHNPICYGGFYETQIDYEANTDYGIELNYMLYNYFLFIEKEYGITLIERAISAR